MCTDQAKCFETDQTQPVSDLAIYVGFIGPQPMITFVPQSTAAQAFILDSYPEMENIAGIIPACFMTLEKSFAFSASAGKQGLTVDIGRNQIIALANQHTMEQTEERIMNGSLDPNGRVFVDPFPIPVA